MVEIGLPSPPFFPTALINWFSEFGQESIQLLLLVLAAVWLAYRLAADYALYTFDMDEFEHAAHMIWSIKIPFFRRLVVLQKGEERQETIPPARELYGGPISLVMDAQRGYAAVLEQTANRVGIFGPQDRYPASSDGFVRLRQVVDLRDQRVEITVDSRTKDGIPVKVGQAGFICRVKGSLLDSRSSIYLSCEKQQIYKLVFHHWIGQDWENPQKRRRALRDLVSTALKDFINRHAFAEILADVTSLAGSIKDIRLTPPLLEQFTGYFEENTGEHGLQLIWTGRGEWQLPQEFDVQAFLPGFRDFYVNWMRGQYDFQTHAAIEIQRREINRLVSHVLRMVANLRQSGEQEDNIMLRLAQHYHERILNAIHLIESRGDKVPQAWRTVADYLDQIVN